MNNNKLKEEYKNKEEDEPKIKKKENQVVKIFLFASLKSLSIPP